MARSTRFPVDAFERGRLPDVCILSGEQTADRMNVRVRNQPAVGWLLLIGVIPYVVVRALLTKSAAGSLPMTEEVYRAVRQGRRAGQPWYLTGFAAAAVGGLLVLAAGLGLPAGLAGLGLAGVAGGLVVMIAGGIVTARANPLRGLRLDRSGRWVELPNAADRFADTVAALMKSGAL